MKHLIFEKLSKREWENRVFIYEPKCIDKATTTYAEFLSYLKNVMTEINNLDINVLALQADNSMSWVAVDLACQLLEKVCIPIPPFFSDEQTEHCLKSAGVEILFTDKADIEDKIKDIQYRSLNTQITNLNAYRLETTQVELPVGTQKITFTSGSTGHPKGVCLSLENQWLVAQALADKVGIDTCHHLGILPYSTLLENIAGIYSPLLSGGCITILGEHQRGLSGSSGMNLPVLLNALSETKANSTILFPQIVSLLIHARQQGWELPDSYQFMAVGGAKVSADLLASAKLNGLPVYQGYGLSECASVVALSDKASPLDVVGEVLPHLHVSIHEGEIVVRGNTFLGYLNQPESWYPNEVKTGDIGSLDGAYLSVSGRNSHLIITSFGRNISPEWVESELCSKPLFSHCVVSGNNRPYLFALVTATESVSDEMIHEHITQSQKGLPDYAQVGVWHRLKPSEWQGLYTANGRPKRALIAEAFKQLEASLYEIRHSA